MSDDQADIVSTGVRRDLDLLTPDDVCALLKVKKSWLYDEVERGALDAIRLGKQLRFRPSDLAHYLDANRR
jgi:excisionase family DNA binding protein